MIVEVHGMGFWTRVRFPPGPLFVVWRDSRNRWASYYKRRSELRRTIILKLQFWYGNIAQLGWAFASHARGHGFEPHCFHHQGLVLKTTEPSRFLLVWWEKRGRKRWEQWSASKYLQREREASGRRFCGDGLEILEEVYRMVFGVGMAWIGDCARWRFRV